MRELRVAALSQDGEHLVLVASGDGQARYRLPVDERLRAALRGQLGRIGQQEIQLESALTPREIQARLRAGESAADVARVAGVPVERITRFEGPVLAERSRVAEQARTASLSVTSGGFTAVPLATIVAEHFAAEQVDSDSAHWDSWRRDDGQWIVELTYLLPQSGAGAANATWLWDPNLARLAPLDDVARRMSEADRQEVRTRPARRPDLRSAPEPDLEPATSADVGDEPAPTSPDDDLAPTSTNESTPEKSPDTAHAPARSASKARRASVPAWADVLLGPDSSA
jgi:hypothetical protein